MLTAKPKYDISLHFLISEEIEENLNKLNKKYKDFTRSDLARQLLEAGIAEAMTFK